MCCFRLTETVRIGNGLVTALHYLRMLMTGSLLLCSSIPLDLAFKGPKKNQRYVIHTPAWAGDLLKVVRAWSQRRLDAINQCESPLLSILTFSGMQMSRG